MKKKLVLLFLVMAFIVIPNVYAADLSGIEIHGFISQGYLQSDENNYLADSEDGAFQFNELGINFSKELTDKLRIGLQFFSRDLGDVGNNEVEIDWAYGDYRWQDWLGIRIGLMKMAQGFYNETRDVDMLRTFILLPQSVYIETSRDYYTRMWGGELYGEIPLNTFGSLSYRALIGTYSPDADNSGLTKFIDDDGVFNAEDMDNGIQYNGSLQWHTPLEGLRIGITGWKQRNFTTSLINSIPLGPGIPAGLPWEMELENWATVYSLEYSWNELILAAEYRYRETSYSVNNLPFDKTIDSEAWYASAAYRFTDWFELGTYYSESYPDKNDKDGDRFKTIGQPDFRAWQKDFALTARFDFNEYWLLKLEGHKMDGAGDLFILDNPDRLEEDWYLFAAKMTFNF
ncbi:porin domain-containing protein [Desulfonema limicola]|uniref:Porin domain-containing protein n=1 Tax=Desulfonema limicola TaxID=45656 RepID=A0A975GJC4_9BACT|nr:hypothetical protein [Desulfonema limicola]QTA83546.1 porin domain-containing protein [Desulfonema limicola]